eukprot:5139923-Amphidinium_carterae.2
MPCPSGCWTTTSSGTQSGPDHRVHQRYGRVNSGRSISSLWRPRPLLLSRKPSSSLSGEA